MNTKIITERENIVAIANAVRSKTGKTEEFTLGEIATEIYEIETGTELPELIVPATEDEVFLNHEYIDANGDKKTGTFTIDTEMSTQNNLISQIQTALANKAQVSPVLQSKSVTPSAAQQIVTADSGYDGLNRVTVTGDANLVPENIMSGVSIFGVEGNASASGGGGELQFFTLTISGDVLLSIVNSCGIDTNTPTQVPYIGMMEATQTSSGGMIITAMYFGQCTGVELLVNGVTVPCNCTIAEGNLDFIMLSTIMLDSGENGINLFQPNDNVVITLLITS